MNTRRYLQVAAFVEETDEIRDRWKFEGGSRMQEQASLYAGRAKRDIEVASIPNTALGTLPVLVPNVVAEYEALLHLFVALGLRRTLFGYVVLLASPLCPVRGSRPSDGGETPILF